MAPNAGVDESRRTELLERFDKTVTELYYLGVTKELLMGRMTALEGGTAT